MPNLSDAVTLGNAVVADAVLPEAAAGPSTSAFEAVGLTYGEAVRWRERW